MKRLSVASTLILLLITLAAGSALGAETEEKRLNLNLKNVPFAEVARNIFYGTGYDFWVDPSLNTLRVSATLKNVTREQALNVITSTAGVVYNVERNTYFFRPDPRSANARGGRPPQNQGPATSRGPIVEDMVTLRYISAGDAASLLNATPPDGLQSITATSANTLLIKGYAVSVAQAEELIRLFDVESALARSVRVALSLKFSAGGGQSPVNLTTQSVGPEGAPMPLSIDFTGKNSDSYKLDMKLIPSVLQNGLVSLTGSGSVECINCGGDASAQHMQKSFGVAASVTPGRPAVIASGSIDAGGTNVEFTVSAVAAVEQGRVVMPRGGMQTAGPDEAHRRAADALLQRIWEAQAGTPKFDAIDAAVLKYREGDAPTRNAIAWASLACMKDKRRAVLDRWPCCYVISRSGYEPGVPDLADVLLHDETEVMRAVAAEALGGWSTSPAARNALLQAERTETSERVREVLNRYLHRQGQ